MSVKSTQHLTREEAEKLYISLRKDFIERSLKVEAVSLENTELEDALEMMDDKINDGESFRNYSINRG